MEPVRKTLELRWKAIFRHYWRFVRPYLRSQVYLVIGYMLGGIGSVVIARIIYKDLVDVVSQGRVDAYATATLLMYALAGTVFFYNVFFRIGDYYMIVSQSRILKDLHDHVHDVLERQSHEFFTNTFAGSLIAKTRRFVNAFETLHDIVVFQLVMHGMQLIAAIAVLWYESYVLGLVFLAWFLMYCVLVRYLVRWQVPKSLANAEMDTKTTAHYSDIISNILTVKMFGSSQYEIASFKKTTTIQERARHAAWMQQSFWNNLYQAIAVGVFEIAIMWVAIWLWHQGMVTPGTLVLVQVYVILSFNVVWQMSKNIIRAMAALSDANEMVEILDRVPTVEDPVEPEAVRFTEGRLELSGVTHRYNGSNGNIFEALDLVIPAGQRVALVGHSGAGKTTIVKLLLRFLDVEEGSITIDGQDIRNVKQDELRQHIAYVPQEPLLFHRTLRENIAYAKPEATLEEVIEVAKRAHAHEFIENLPHGYDTLVGERGIKLSGGERQRVAIARAMLTDAKVVILDEATSSLDSLSEQYIQAGFDALMEGRTTIVIAHRLSTIQHMDRIIVLDKGKVVEDGIHSELIANQGIYAELWKAQVGGFISE